MAIKAPVVGSINGGVAAAAAAATAAVDDVGKAKDLYGKPKDKLARS